MGDLGLLKSPRFFVSKRVGTLYITAVFVRSIVLLCMYSEIIFNCLCHSKFLAEYVTDIGTFMCCSGDANKIKLTTMEQLYASVFRLRLQRRFDDADKLQSLVDLLCNGLYLFAVLYSIVFVHSS